VLTLNFDSKSELNYASLQWFAIQTFFEGAESDVLLLLDCCAAASGAPMEGDYNNVTETIAACGFETSAPQPGRHSFTNTLIEVLDDWQSRPVFTAAMLHCEILNRLRHEKPEKYRDSKKFEFRKSPIHITSTSNPKAKSVELSPRPLMDVVGRAGFRDSGGLGGRGASISMVQSLIGNQQTDRPSNSLPADPVPGDGDDAYSIATLTRILDDGSTALPQVLIALALEEEQSLDFQQCRRWLQDFPALVKYARVQGIYKSNSTLLILSVPVVIWDWIPDDPACSFIDYVHSQNVLERTEGEKLTEDLKRAAMVWNWIPDHQVSPFEKAESETLVEDIKAVERASIASEFLALVTFAFQSVLSLSKTVDSLQSKPRVIREFTEELEALCEILETLQQAPARYSAYFPGLHFPVSWCGKVCAGFEAVLIREIRYSGGLSTSFRDWAKLRYAGHDFVELKYLLEVYKSTLRIGMGVANLYVLYSRLL
jgi:hypothetical protein